LEILFILFKEKGKKKFFFEKMMQKNKKASPKSLVVISLFNFLVEKIVV